MASNDEINKMACEAAVIFPQDMSDDQLKEELIKWLDRESTSRTILGRELAFRMSETIIGILEKRSEPLDPMRGVEFPFVENH